MTLIAARILRRYTGLVSFRNSPVWWSVVVWCVFTVYWSIAARNSAAAKKSESGSSRQLHVLMVNIGLLPALIPVPGLRQRFLPDSTPDRRSGPGDPDRVWISGRVGAAAFGRQLER